VKRFWDLVAQVRGSSLAFVIHRRHFYADVAKSG